LIDVYTRDNYFVIMTESLDHCRKNKGMGIYGNYIMPSHAHFIFRSAQKDPSGSRKNSFSNKTTNQYKFGV
jgi:putative transposase